MGEKMIEQYKKYGVDPKTKLLLFSDSLDFNKAQKLYDYFSGKTKVSFGIGTFVSNDTDETALNIVIKLQYVNGRPVAKLSDTPGKAMCRDQYYLEYLKRSVNFRLNREKWFIILNDYTFFFNHKRIRIKPCNTKMYYSWLLQ